MKKKTKTAIICVVIAVCCVIAIGFGVKTHHDKEVAAAKAHSEKVEKAHKRKLAKKRKEKKKREAQKKEQQAQSSSQQQSGQQAQNAQQSDAQQQPQQSQSQINRQRGYDPNGNPLLPGQDHAAGSNPDGSPDAWVQWQLDHANDTTFPDGTPFPNGGQ